MALKIILKLFKVQIIYHLVFIIIIVIYIILSIILIIINNLLSSTNSFYNGNGPSTLKLEAIDIKLENDCKLYDRYICHLSLLSLS